MPLHSNAYLSCHLLLCNLSFPHFYPWLFHGTKLAGFSILILLLWALIFPSSHVRQKYISQKHALSWSLTAFRKTCVILGRKKAWHRTSNPNMNITSVRHQEYKTSEYKTSEYKTDKSFPSPVLVSQVLHHRKREHRMNEWMNECKNNHHIWIKGGRVTDKRTRNKESNAKNLLLMAGGTSTTTTDTSTTSSNGTRIITWRSQDKSRIQVK